MKKFILGAAFLAGLAACNKNGAEPTIDFGPAGGITARDAQARLSGQVDPTDWTSDAKWNATEIGLFSDLPFELNASTQSATFGFVAYPNAASKDLLLNCHKPDSVAIKMVVVDKRYSVIRSTTIPSNTQGVSVNYALNEIDFPKNQLYRIYYVLHHRHGFYSKGHGDFKVVEYQRPPGTAGRSLLFYLAYKIL
jgi:hypothetical protein